MIEITGPFYRRKAPSKAKKPSAEQPSTEGTAAVPIAATKTARKRKSRRKPWYLYWRAPKENKDGTIQLNSDGTPKLKRHRPQFETREAAEAEKARLDAQFNKTGASEFLFDRAAASDYDAAKKIIGNVAMVEAARFWRLHHPEEPKEKIKQLFPQFIAAEEKRLGRTRHTDDLKSRVGIFVKTVGERYPDTVVKREVLAYIAELDMAPRSARNHKQSICRFFNWLLAQGHITANPAAGIKKCELRREPKNDIEYLKLDRCEQYLRAAERYDPDLIPHEIVQLFAGVRADDEMANFKAEYVVLEMKQVRVPASISKMGEPDIIEGLEECFWNWWGAYGKDEGLLRVKNYEPRWFRIRVLASVLDQQRADELARLPIKTPLKMELAKKALADWPWNARRRTFCTYHIAKHQGADKTATLMRHQGGTATLWKSYRGLGVTQSKGVAYFEIQPRPVPHPIRHELPLRGIVRKQAERIQPMSQSHQYVG